MRYLFIMLTLLAFMVGSVVCSDSTEVKTKDTTEVKSEDTTEVKTETAEENEQPAAADKQKTVEVITTESGLRYIDHVVGDGDEAVKGTTVEVHYTGWLQEKDGSKGKKFDSSKDRDQPFSFSLPGRVIAGWNEGVAGMKVGSMRELIIPSDLAYGPQGRPPIIPPNATLIFDVELLKVTKM